jgi:hypothetical protein
MLIIKQPPIIAHLHFIVALHISQCVFNALAYQLIYTYALALTNALYALHKWL